MIHPYNRKKPILPPNLKVSRKARRRMTKFIKELEAYNRMYWLPRVLAHALWNMQDTEAEVEEHLLYLLSTKAVADKISPKLWSKLKSMYDNGEPINILKLIQSVGVNLNDLT
jgi:hypothetical protein